MTSDLMRKLSPKERRGSKPRCHILTHGIQSEVAARLTELTAPFGIVSSNDAWMPDGFGALEEAQLHRAPRLLDDARREQLKSWWLAPNSQNGRTPNFDIASTCLIDGERGLLLVEAKAHDEELIKEAAGRRVDASENRLASHDKIGAAITSARHGLETTTALSWQISRDNRYQMSNRFAWAWKLTELGIPVVLVYLGFLHAEEMSDRGRPFASHAEWERLVKSHSEPLFPPEVWGQGWGSTSKPLIPLIRSVEVSLDDFRPTDVT